jgi:hypothetical protein
MFVSWHGDAKSLNNRMPENKVTDRPSFEAKNTKRMAEALIWADAIWKKNENASGCNDGAGRRNGQLELRAAEGRFATLEKTPEASHEEISKRTLVFLALGGMAFRRNHVLWICTEKRSRAH